MKKFLYAALIVFALGFISCGAASADETLVNSMSPGTWTTNPRYITFGEYNGHALKWRVLEVYGDKTAFLVLDDVLRNPVSEGGGAVVMAFDDRDNSFPDSQINTWLKDTFLPALLASLNTDDEDCILDTAYGPDNRWGYEWNKGDGPENGSSKIFLLSVNEAAKPEYFFDGDNYNTSHLYYLPNADRDVDEDYWLRSPGDYYYNAAVVMPGGLVADLGFNVISNELAVRPALKINLSSAVFKSDFVSYPNKKES